MAASRTPSCSSCSPSTGSAPRSWPGAIEAASDPDGIRCRVLCRAGRHVVPRQRGLCPPLDQHRFDHARAQLVALAHAEPVLSPKAPTPLKLTVRLGVRVELTPNCQVRVQE